MSMLSSQIDRLREAAQTYRGFGNHTMEQMLLGAADTITELRDDLQRANAENAKLREELADAPKCDACEAMLDCDECLRADGSHKERRRLSSENAKLQKLVQDMWFWLYCENVCQKSDKEQAVIIADIIARMGELGVEPKFTEEDE